MRAHLPGHERRRQGANNLSLWFAVRYRSTEKFRARESGSQRSSDSQKCAYFVFWATLKRKAGDAGGPNIDETQQQYQWRKNSASRGFVGDVTWLRSCIGGNFNRGRCKKLADDFGEPSSCNEPGPAGIAVRMAARASLGTPKQTRPPHSAPQETPEKHQSVVALDAGLRIEHVDGGGKDACTHAHHAQAPMCRRAFHAP